jgi:hypothetical protein
MTATFFVVVDFTRFFIYVKNIKILVDVGAIMAFIADEPEGPTVLRLT